MQTLNKKNLIAILILGLNALLFWIFKDNAVNTVKNLFEGSGVYVFPSTVLTIFIVVHFAQNRGVESVQNKELVSLVDYILFLGTHIVIICTVITLLRESF
jgi:hypothetical protein